MMGGDTAVPGNLGSEMAPATVRYTYMHVTVRDWMP